MILYCQYYFNYSLLESCIDIVCFRPILLYLSAKVAVRAIWKLVYLFSVLESPNLLTVITFCAADLMQSAH